LAFTDKLTEKFPAREVSKLRKDVELLKEMVRSEKLRNSELQIQLDKERLAREIESPSYKLAHLKLQMEREQLKLQE